MTDAHIKKLIATMLSSLSFQAAVLLGAGWGAGDLCTVSSAASAWMSKQDLINGIAISRSSIVSVDVAFHFEATADPGPSLTHDNRHVIVDATRYFSERHYGFMNDGVPSDCLLASSYDGQQAVQYYGTTRIAVIAHAIDPVNFHDINLSGAGFFDLILYYPGSAPKPAEYDLGTLIDSDLATVRPELEPIDNSPCHVIDVHDNSGNLRITVWIDTNKGFLPVRRVHWLAGNSGQALMSFEITNAVEMLPGSWLPLEGNKVIGEIPAQSDAGPPVGYHMLVDTRADGTPALTLNANLSAEIFDYSNQLPPHTRISNLDTRQTWIVSSQNFNAGADAALASLGRPVDRVSPVSSAGMDRPGFAWVGTALVAAAAGLWSGSRSRGRYAPR